MGGSAQSCWYPWALRAPEGSLGSAPALGSGWHPPNTAASPTATQGGLEHLSLRPQAVGTWELLGTHTCLVWFRVCILAGMVTQYLEKRLTLGVSHTELRCQSRTPSWGGCC